MTEMDNINIEDLKSYSELTLKIENRLEELYKIATDEFPEQFGSFIFGGAFLNNFEIVEEGIYGTFEERRGDWCDTYSIKFSFEEFSDPEIFKKSQIQSKKDFLNNIEKKKIKLQASKLAEEKAQYEKLKEKFDKT